MVEMTVAGLAIDAESRSPIVLLRDPSGRRQVPIWVDHAQAHNIITGMRLAVPTQPSTHDLIMEVLKASNFHLKKVIIHAIEDRTFKAILKIKKSPLNKAEKDKNCFSELEINARPSDAIALAVRTPCSIWMLENVLADTSIPVNIEADAKDQDEFKRFLNETSPSELIRHLQNRKQINEESSDS